MMYPVYGVHTPDALPLTYPQDVFLDDLSTQRPSSQALRRLSKGSVGQRAGTPMRVSKPNSTNSSPRSLGIAGRRRTVISNDAWTPQRQQQVMDYFSAPPKQPARPVSWHPSSYLQAMPQQLPQQPLHLQKRSEPYGMSTPNLYGAGYAEPYAGQPQFSPVMTSCSNDTSPSSTFSPLPIYPSADQVQQAQVTAWNDSQKTFSVHYFNESTHLSEPYPMVQSQVNARDNGMGELDWNSFIVQGFNNTTPPTPEALPQLRDQTDMVKNTISYEPLDEPEEEEGEILVGMGLYDAPEKICEDPQLNHYRSTVSSLMGSTYRPQESMGKGLKLEETWEPPKTYDDDGGDEEDEDEDDEA